MVATFSLRVWFIAFMILCYVTCLLTDDGQGDVMYAVGAASGYILFALEMVNITGRGHRSRPRMKSGELSLLSLFQASHPQCFVNMTR